MSTPPGAPEDVEALILAGGRGERLGLGPKALLVLGGETLLARAVTAMRPLARRIVVGVPAEHVEPLRHRFGGDVTVVPGGETRVATLVRLFSATTASLVVVHDPVHPFVTTELGREVVATAHRHGAATAAHRPSAYVYQRLGADMRRLTPAGSAWILTRPSAFRREPFRRGLAAGPVGDATPIEILARVGQTVELIPSAPWNFKVTTPEEWSLAQALVASALVR